MVQRKAQSKLGTQATITEAEEKWVLRSMANPKTPSPQYPDGKTRGADLKVKMKKSGSIKRTNLDSLKSSSFRKEIPQPGKPPTPPHHGVKSLESPQKQTPVRSSGDGVPNYMKSTSCSDARKELSPPRTRRSSTESKTSSPETNTPTKALKRSSSLKLARTLTRTPSFKPARSSLSASAKKCSKAVLCSEMESQRATCSSTLKDSKFPQYLTLSAGATEAEGTSAVKVCPYSYCSLNGHRHAPLPPLKCFISARRRSLKMQRSFKAEVLSPKRRLGKKAGTDVNVAKKDLDDETDFFVEVYAVGDDGKDCSETEASDKQSNNDEAETEPSVKQSNNDKAEAEAESNNDKAETEFSVSAEEGKETEESEFQQIAEIINDNSMESIDNMEWDEARSFNAELEGETDEARSFNAELEGETENSPEKGDETELKNGAICFNFVTINLNIHVYSNLMEKDEVDACSDEDQQSEISEPSRVSDCFNYDQFSEDEVEEADAEEVETKETGETEEAEESEGTERAEETGETEAEETEETEQAEETGEACEEIYGNVMEADEVPENANLQGSAAEEKQEESDAIEQGCDEEQLIIVQETEQCTDSRNKEEQSKEEDTINDSTMAKPKSSYTRPLRSCPELPDPSKITICKNKCREVAEEEEDNKGFNPRDPNYLPIVPDPDAEKIDLKHKAIDERKNSEDWMVDYALQRTVTKLGSARKRKVALLVEAFEKVRKWDNHLLMSPTAIQACS